MKDKFSVFLNANGIKIDAHYKLEDLLDKIRVKSVFVPDIAPNEAQIQVFDCHGNYEMTNYADYRRLVLPIRQRKQDRSWTIARLLGAWINAKVDNAGNYNESLSYLMSIGQLETIDRPRLSSVQNIALQILLPDEMLKAILPDNIDESDYAVIARYLQVPVQVLSQRLKQYKGSENIRGE